MIKPPFIVSPSAIHGMGLFTCAGVRFGAGNELGFAFIKVADKGKFKTDYAETFIGRYINHSENANVKITKHPKGLLMTAITDIEPGTEITANYREVIDLFPDDETFEGIIKYW